MARIGDHFRTGQICVATGSYTYDGYSDGTSTPAPAGGERVRALSANQKFPSIESTAKRCWWRLERIA